MVSGINTRRRPRRQPDPRSIRRLAVLLIDYLGPMSTWELASQLGVWPETAKAIVTHPAFGVYPRDLGPPLYTLAKKIRRSERGR